jgi:hypothetical protein
MLRGVPHVGADPQRTKRGEERQKMLRYVLVHVQGKICVVQIRLFLTAGICLIPEGGIERAVLALEVSVAELVVQHARFCPDTYFLLFLDDDAHGSCPILVCV